MKNIIYSLFTTLLIPFFCFAQEKPNEENVTSEINDVTVFKSGAQISRKKEIQLEGGITTLNFKDLTYNLDPKSIQVKANEQIIILSVEHKIEYIEADQKPELLQKYYAQIDSIQDLINYDQVLSNILNEEEDFIKANNSIAGTSTGIQNTELISIDQYYSSRIKEISLEKFQLYKRQKEYKQARQSIDRKLADLGKINGEHKSNIIVKVDCPTSINSHFDLKYLVKDAGWDASYDLRVKDVENPINLLYKANVYQSSGEVWKNVKLTLSTGEPKQSSKAPSLDKWSLGFYTPYQAQNDITIRGSRSEQTVYYIDGVRVSEGIKEISGVVRNGDGEPLIGASVLVEGTSIGTITNIDGKYSLQVPFDKNEMTVSYIGFIDQSRQINDQNMNFNLYQNTENLDEIVITGLGINRSKHNLATSSQGISINNIKSNKNKKSKTKTTRYVTSAAIQNTTTFEFEIKNPYTILSNGIAQAVSMEAYEIPTYYEYFCIPKVDTDVFLTAQFTDWQELHLQDGEVNLFFEGTYIGRSFLNVKELSDTLNISLGRDKGILVERTRIKDESKKQFIGNKITELVSWNIEVKNNKSQKINLVLKDQFPVSTFNEIEVKQIEHVNGKLNTNNGEIEWSYQLDPKEKATEKFVYSVKYPKNKTLLIQ